MRIANWFPSKSAARYILPTAVVFLGILFAAQQNTNIQGQSPMAAGVKDALWAAVGALLFFAAVLHQKNTKLAASLISLHTSLEATVARRTESISALLRINTAVTNTLAVEEVLTIAGQHAQEIFHADTVLLWLLPAPQEIGSDEGSFDLLPICCGQEPAPRLLRQLAAAPTSLQAEALLLPAEPRPQHSAAANLTITTKSALPGQPGVSESCIGKAAVCCLRAPLIWQQQVLGRIDVLRRTAGFETFEKDLLLNIGAQVATGCANARVYAAAVQAADHDPVTGLLNHRALHQRLDMVLESARLSYAPCVVIMLDLNNFKLFNDTYGHPVGDEVLRHVADTLRSGFPPSATLGRYGGDEFSAVLPDMTMEQAIRAIEEISARLLAHGFQPGEDERVVPITLSVGLSAFPEDGASRHDLLTVAGTHLYATKYAGERIGCSTAFQRANRELRMDASYGALEAMVSAVDNKDSYTRQHSEDVTEYALWIGEELGLAEDALQALRVGGLLHDVGKIGVPNEILRKPGRLTEEEYMILKRHPVLGALIVGSIPGMERILEVVRSHHERWDGKGYPDGLSGEDIPLLGRIAAVADAFSAMTTHRPYRRGMDWDIALAEIKANIGTQFDPVPAHAFLSAVSKRQGRPLKALQPSPCSLPAAA